jgi:hypothetical protein
VITPDEAARFAALHKCETTNCTNPKDRKYGSRLCWQCYSDAWKNRALITKRIANAFERFADVRKSREAVGLPWLTEKEFATLCSVEVGEKPIVGFFVFDKYERVDIFAKWKRFNGGVHVWQHRLVFESEVALYTFREAAEQAFPQLRENWS